MKIVSSFHFGMVGFSNQLLQSIAIRHLLGPSKYSPTSLVLNTTTTIKIFKKISPYGTSVYWKTVTCFWNTFDPLPTWVQNLCKTNCFSDFLVTSFFDQLHQLLHQPLQTVDKPKLSSLFLSLSPLKERKQLTRVWNKLNCS